MPPNMQFSQQFCPRLQAPILAYPDFTLGFTLATDASDHGLGYVLGQVQNGREVLIAYGGRKLLPA